MWYQNRRELSVRIMRTVDLAVLCSAFLAAMAISSRSYSWHGISNLLLMRVALGNVLLFAGFLVACSITFAACGFYHTHRLSPWVGRLSQVLVAATLIAGMIMMMRRVRHFWFATDAFLLTFWFLVLTALFLTRESVRVLLYLARVHGRNLRHVVIIGQGDDANVLAKRVRVEAGLGYHVVAVLDVEESDDETIVHPIST